MCANQQTKSESIACADDTETKDTNESSQKDTKGIPSSDHSRKTNSEILLNVSKLSETADNLISQVPNLGFVHG